MGTWLAIGLFALGIVLAFPTAVLISAAAGAVISRRREHCPACGQRRLRWVQLIRRGRARESWSYFLCESCGARYKQRVGGEFEIPSEADLAQVFFIESMMKARTNQGAAANQCSALSSDGSGDLGGST
jgi:hypothetical protein